MRIPTTSLYVLASLLAAACAPHETHALAPPTEEQALAAQTFMETTLEPAAEGVWNSVGFIIDASGEHDLSPQSDAEWDALVERIDVAQILVEGLKTASFSWDDATWSGYADGVLEALDANQRAAERHDVEGLFEAGETLDTACESCHLHFEEGEAAGEGLEALEGL